MPSAAVPAFSGRRAPLRRGSCRARRWPHRSKGRHHRGCLVHRRGAAGLAGAARCRRQSPPHPERVMTPLDPFVVEVIRHGLSAAAEEMSLVMTRSARSPLLREAGDLSSAITDAEGGLVGQGKDIPIHLGAMAYTVRELLKVRPAAGLREGDAIIYNLGALGGNHLNDVKIARPVFVEGTARRLRAEPCPLARCRRHLARKLSRRRLRHVPGGDPHPAADHRDGQGHRARRARPHPRQCPRSRVLRGRPDGPARGDAGGRAAHPRPLRGARHRRLHRRHGAAPRPLRSGDAGGHRRAAGRHL